MTCVVLTEYIYIFVWRALACTMWSRDYWIGTCYRNIRAVSAGICTDV